MKKLMDPRFIVSGLAALLVSSVVSAQTPTPTPQPLQFYAITPCRIVDTRGPTGLTGGPAMVGDAQRNFPIDVSPAACGIPSTAKAAVLNFVVVGPQGGGHLRVWPYGLTYPGVATLNFDANEPAIANGAIAPLTVDPNFQLSIVVKMGSASLSANLVIDATGYFQ